jgi:hypothetical protein
MGHASGGSRVASRSIRRWAARPADGLGIDSVVESDRTQLTEIVQRVRDDNGRLRTNIGDIANLDDAIAALNPTGRRNGRTVIRVRP